MDIQAALLCDSATDYRGKLCILGTFDTIITQNLPSTHPHCSIALRIVFRDSDEGTTNSNSASSTKTAKTSSP
jgi:hypothetical protein